MVVEMDEPPAPQEELTTRIPEEADLVALCRALNQLSAKYIVIGGFAIALTGFARTTLDVDLLIDTSLENEALVYKALEILPDKAVRELRPGETSRYGEVQGVPIPFASPRVLWRTKKPTQRPKDVEDLMFLEQYFLSKGEEPPKC
jgi:hypothetical protein